MLILSKKTYQWHGVHLNGTSVLWLGYSSHNGRKPNQDRILVFFHKEYSYLLVGIFDGHGTDGHLVATSIRNRFLLSFLQKGKSHQEEASSAMRSALSEAEQLLLQDNTINSKRSGCTANIGLLCFDTEHHVKLTSLNVGDSECIFSYIVSCRLVMFSKSDKIVHVTSINAAHSLTTVEEQQRIIESGGVISNYQVAPYVPSVPRVFANKECTRGGLAMSRSLGDQLIHRFGVISDPTFEVLDFADSRSEEMILLFGSDGFLAYADKNEVASFFLNTTGLENSLSLALHYAQTYLLGLTQQKYADDTSGVAIVLHHRKFQESKTAI